MHITLSATLTINIMCIIGIIIIIIEGIKAIKGKYFTKLYMTMIIVDIIILIMIMLANSNILTITFVP